LGLALRREASQELRPDHSNLDHRNILFESGHLGVWKVLAVFVQQLRSKENDSRLLVQKEKALRMKLTCTILTRNVIS